MSRQTNLEEFKAGWKDTKRILLYLHSTDLRHVTRIREIIAREQEKPAELVNMQDVVRRALRTGK